MAENKNPEQTSTVTEDKNYGQTIIAAENKNHGQVVTAIGSKNSKRVVIATENEHKLKEIGDILKDFNLEILSIKDVGLERLEIVEDGATFEENALIKAKAIMERTGELTIADDSGLEVDILDNQPGIYSARFAGENATDDENNKKLLELLEGIPLYKRTARFVCSIAVVFPNGDTVVLRGECPGTIGLEPKGKDGFGYDSLFITGRYNKTFAEIGEEKKNKISHRAAALKKLKEELTFRQRKTDGIDGAREESAF